MLNTEIKNSVVDGYLAGTNVLFVAAIKGNVICSSSLYLLVFSMLVRLDQQFSASVIQVLPTSVFN